MNPLYVPSKEFENYLKEVLHEVFYYKERGLPRKSTNQCTERILNNLKSDIERVQCFVPKELVQSYPNLPTIIQVPIKKYKQSDGITKQCKTKKPLITWFREDNEKLLRIVNTYTIQKLPANWEIVSKLMGRSIVAVREQFHRLNKNTIY